MSTESLESAHLKHPGFTGSQMSPSDSDEEMSPLHQPHSTSEVFDLGHYGKLHEITMTGDHFTGLREHCLKTSCNFTTQACPGAHFPSPILKLLQQTAEGHGHSQITKLMDGFLVHTRNGIVRAAIYDDHLVRPDSLNQDNVKNPSNKGYVKIFALAAPPGRSVKHFILKPNHDGITQHHEISNFMPVERIVSKMKSAMALQHKVPRVIYSSPNFCTLKGYNLQGNEAKKLKDVFLKLLKVTNGGQQMYDTVLKLPSEVSEALSLRKASGDICIAPLQNGIMGFRKRESDDGQTLIFLASSNDFHHSAPLPTDQSVVQIYKLNYTSNAKDANRIFVSTNPAAEKMPRCPFHTAPITPNMSVQDALNHIEYASRKALMEHKGCSLYPQYVYHMMGINGLQNSIGQHFESNLARLRQLNLMGA